MPSNDRAAILLLSGTLALINAACSQVNSLLRSPESPEPAAVVSATPSPATTPPANRKLSATPTRQPAIAPKDAYEQGLDAAYSAAIIAQSAQSSDDWQLVTNRWQEAIALLKKVPSSSSYHAIAQSKIAQYQRNLGIAQQQATRPRPDTPSRTTVATAPLATGQPPSPSQTQTENVPPPTTDLAPTAEPKTNSANSRVFKAPIKRREGRTPVINVTFNGGQTFEMIVDTGASGTVITQAMAAKLNVVPEGEVTADTASAKDIKFRIGRVQSIAVDGAVARNVGVAIGGPDLELGLLGQDFYGNYDVWIRQDVVEFHPR